MAREEALARMQAAHSGATRDSVWVPDALLDAPLHLLAAAVAKDVVLRGAATDTSGGTLLALLEAVAQQKCNASDEELVASLLRQRCDAAVEAMKAATQAKLVRFARQGDWRDEPVPLALAAFALLRRLDARARTRVTLLPQAVAVRSPQAANATVVLDAAPSFEASAPPPPPTRIGTCRLVAALAEAEWEEASLATTTQPLAVRGGHAAQGDTRRAVATLLDELLEGNAEAGPF